jgi:hypothetical protein
MGWLLYHLGWIGKMHFYTFNRLPLEFFTRIGRVLEEFYKLENHIRPEKKIVGGAASAHN